MTYLAYLAYLTTVKYIIFLISVMIAAGIIKEHNLFLSLFILIINKVKSKRAVVFLISLFSGVLPIPGRVLVSAGILDSLAPKVEDNPKSRSKFGIIDYLATHHYYLWSPLEKTVIVPMAAAGISYGAFIGYMWPLLLITIVYILYYIFIVLKEDDIILDIDYESFILKDFIFGVLPLFLGIFGIAFGIGPWFIFPIVMIYYSFYTKTSPKKWLTYINWHLVLLLIVIISLSVFIGTHSALFEQLLQESTLGINYAFYLASLGAFAASWIMGSSGRYAGIAAIMITMFGVEYLVWFLTIEFIAYNLSPTHKCIHIGRMYFQTSFLEYFKAISIWLLLLLIYAIFSII